MIPYTAEQKQKLQGTYTYIQTYTIAGILFWVRMMNRIERKQMNNNNNNNIINNNKSSMI